MIEGSMRKIIHCEDGYFHNQSQIHAHDYSGTHDVYNFVQDTLYKS